MGGCLGLNYPSIPVVMDLASIPKKKRKQIFEDIQILEQAALKVLNSKYEKDGVKIRN